MSFAVDANGTYPVNYYSPDDWTSSAYSYGGTTWFEWDGTNTEYGIYAPGTAPLNCGANCPGSANMSFVLPGYVPVTFGLASVDPPSTEGNWLDCAIPGNNCTTGNEPNWNWYASSPVPEPGTLTLFGTGLIGVAGLLRRKLKS
jgi:hypothetical protein